MDCIFCKIVNGDIPSYKIYEDDLVIAYLDINPKANGHTLIVPKNHTLDLDTIDNETLMHIMEVARILKSKLENKLNIDGLVLVQNNGLPQEVKHYHLHLIPAYKEEQELINVEDIYKKIEE
jgi:histidine triad (HIT) family protein